MNKSLLDYHNKRRDEVLKYIKSLKSSGCLYNDGYLEVLKAGIDAIEGGVMSKEEIEDLKNFLYTSSRHSQLFMLNIKKKIKKEELFELDLFDRFMHLYMKKIFTLDELIPFQEEFKENSLKKLESISMTYTVIRKIKKDVK